MTDSPCPHSPVALAAAHARLARNPELDRHLASCPACRDALAVDSALRGAAEALAPELPSPAALRFRAERRRGELARARALAPVRLWTATAAVALTGTLAFLGRDLAPVARLFAAGVAPPPEAPTAAGAGLALFALLTLAALAGVWLSAVEGPE